MSVVMFKHDGSLKDDNINPDTLREFNLMNYTAHRSIAVLVDARKKKMGDISRRKYHNLTGGFVVATCVCGKECCMSLTRRFDVSITLLTHHQKLCAVYKSKHTPRHAVEKAINVREILVGDIVVTCFIVGH